MKNILLVSAIAALTTTAFAADLKPYIEGSVGYARPDDAQISFVDGTGPGNYRANYDNDVNYGFEIGASNVLNPNIRLGAQFIKYQFDQKSGTTTFGDGSIEADDQSDFEKMKAKVYLLNAYYDFNNASKITPFIGLGMGKADVDGSKNNEFSWATHLGGKYNFNDNLYLGLKGSYLRINGGDIECNTVTNCKAQDADVISGNVLLGYQF
jgi:opacity protein-like surface antigen